MGFIDWICEPNAELRGRYLDSILVHEWTEPARVGCPLCKETFGTTEELLSHTRLQHPLGLPLLLISGSIATTQIVIRNPLSSSSLRIENCSKVELSVEGKPFETVTPKKLSSRLVRMHDGWVRLRLTNARGLDQAEAVVEHRIDFRIAKHDTLAAIDRHFIDCMGRLPIAVSSVKAFWDECGDLTDTKAAADYANALSNYVIGLAIKQGRDSGTVLPFDRFKDKFMEALSVLGRLDLPLAVGVSEVIRFNLNDFTGWMQAEASFPGLGRAAQFFHSPARTLSASRSPRRVALNGMAKCPVDDLTERIIEATLLITEHRFNDVPLLTLLPPLMSWTPLPEYDRQKLHVLVAAMFLGQGRPGDAGPHLRALRSDPNFGSWSSQYLGS